MHGSRYSAHSLPSVSEDEVHTVYFAMLKVLDPAKIGLSNVAPYLESFRKFQRVDGPAREAASAAGLKMNRVLLVLEFPGRPRAESRLRHPKINCLIKSVAGAAFQMTKMQYAGARPPAHQACQTVVGRSPAFRSSGMLRWQLI